MKYIRCSFGKCDSFAWIPLGKHFLNVFFFCPFAAPIQIYSTHQFEMTLIRWIPRNKWALGLNHNLSMSSFCIVHALVLNGTFNIKILGNDFPFFREWTKKKRRSTFQVRRCWKVQVHEKRWYLRIENQIPVMTFTIPMTVIIFENISSISNWKKKKELQRLVNNNLVIFPKGFFCTRFDNKLFYDDHVEWIRLLR